MRIYMVREHVEYESYDIIGAYLNKEDAEAHVVQAQEAKRYDVEHSVEEWEVN